jgi:hypothetical protein
VPPTDGVAKSASKLSSSPPTYDASKAMSMSQSPETSIVSVENDDEFEETKKSVKKLPARCRCLKNILWLTVAKIS